MKKILCYTHSADMDGHCSGAIFRYKFPDAEIRGWNYGEDVPELSDLKRFVKVYMADITFPLPVLQQYGKEIDLTVIDHHISYKKQVDELDEELSFEYVFDNKVAACELVWRYLFQNVKMPFAVRLIGRYDTWRTTEGDWEETLDFNSYAYSQCNSFSNFPEHLLSMTLDPVGIEDETIELHLEVGRDIRQYEKFKNETSCKSLAFEKKIGPYTALCINNIPNSNPTTVLESVYNPEKHDFMISFSYSKDGMWNISYRSIDAGPDVSEIARQKGGGGHRNAAGCRVNTFEEIFKI